MDRYWSDPEKERNKMVQEQIALRQVRDPRVLEAMRKVPRELFIPREDYQYAFYDGPLSIGFGQTISQPYIVAYMTENLELRGTERVLEIGTGSGYQTAVLAELAAEVYTMEIIDALLRRAEKRLAELGYGNIHFRSGDGSDGWPEEAPFDAIVITAAPEMVPERLGAQLREGGRMIVPVGRHIQYLLKIVRRGSEYDKQKLIGVRFVPMTGKIQEGE
ncbi:MAG: protein-L-isoaspartate(D-aspartate) O-methyltransferase [Candidatus Krumholzibacteriota bacterium]|nr:protein-L-isoaspartate(D-aspartate) O-methyltransferase [Candidatus Krumholzibacteriota bacterium]